MTKKVLSIIVALALTAILFCLPVAAEDPPDDPILVEETSADPDDGGKISEWAKAEVARAEELDLIPDSLLGADLTKPINRAEFAAVSVKVFEALSEEEATPAEDNPFTDTEDAEVLKAYEVRITNGVAEDTFAPEALLVRQEAATMLARVFKKVSNEEWTLENDSEFPFEDPELDPFTDDAAIADWAKDSVYFMAANEIIKGMGDGTFAPKSNTTREQAIAIALRMVENLEIDE
ncbi:MAG: S-layer homology domain-containing protein [Clostridiales bacterium]|nr:S-layer homology domain-containing protein [Clostridiales bacterium]